MAKKKKRNIILIILAIFLLIGLTTGSFLYYNITNSNKNIFSIKRDSVRDSDNNYTKEFLQAVLQEEPEFVEDDQTNIDTTDNVDRIDTHKLPNDYHLSQNINSNNENEETKNIAESIIAPLFSDNSNSSKTLDTKSNIAATNTKKPAPLNVTEDINAGKRSNINYTGKRINIAVTGVDSRLGTTMKHADANHVISIMVDIGKIQIISIPRDTYVDCGYDDTTGLNKLTVLRAGASRKTYLRAVAKIAKLDKIDYFIEFGFSQAIGLIELLGYKNAVSTLRVLRSRNGLGGSDYQRVFNQAQFIKQNLINKWELINSVTGDLLVRAGLMTVETNLTIQNVNEIKKILSNANFGSKDDIEIKIRPAIPIKYKVYELSNQETIATLTKKLDNFNKYAYKDTLKSRNISRSVEKTIMNEVNKIRKANFKSISVNKLDVLFNQKAWLQIENKTVRDSVRDMLCNTLITYYTQKNKSDRISEIKNYLNLERESNSFKEN